MKWTPIPKKCPEAGFYWVKWKKNAATANEESKSVIEICPNPGGTTEFEIYFIGNDVPYDWKTARMNFIKIAGPDAGPEDK